MEDWGPFALLFLAVPLTARLVADVVRSRRPPRQAVERARFGAAYGCRVPPAQAAWFDELVVRRVLRDSVAGVGVVALVAGWTLVVGSGRVEPRSESLVGSVTAFAGLAVLWWEGWQLAWPIRPADPLPTTRKRVARPRAGPLRAVLAAVTVCTGALALAAGWAAVTGRHPAMFWVLVGALALLASHALLVLEMRRSVARPEPAADEAQLFLLDAHRHQQILTAALSQVAITVFVLVLMGLAAGRQRDVQASDLWIGLLASGGAWLVLRTNAAAWYLARLWPDGVPASLRADATRDARQVTP